MITGTLDKVNDKLVLKMRSHTVMGRAYARQASIIGGVSDKVNVSESMTSPRCFSGEGSDSSKIASKC